MSGLFVTGSKGFVGAQVVERARERGQEVMTATGDLRDQQTVRAQVEELQPTAVVHLADAKGEDPWESLADNIRMLGNVLGALARHAPSATLLVPGTAAQYGMGSADPLPETAPCAAVTDYGAAKSVLETAALGALRRSVRVIWTRSFNHLGPGQGLGAPVPSWARQVALAERTGSGTVRTGRLDVIRDFLDVRDVADAYLALVESSAEGIVNVCSGDGVALEKVAQRLLGMSSASIDRELDPGLLRSADPPCVVGDPGRLRAWTGWTPAYSLEQSMADVLDEWRKHVSEPMASERSV